MTDYRPLFGPGQVASLTSGLSETVLLGALVLLGRFASRPWPPATLAEWQTSLQRLASEELDYVLVFGLVLEAQALGHLALPVAEVPAFWLKRRRLAHQDDAEIPTPPNPDTLDSWLQRVAASDPNLLTTAADERAPTPFLWRDGKLYTQRSHSQEGRIASLLASRLTLAPLAANQLIPTGGPTGQPSSEAAADQARAVSASLGQRLFVLTGGPGTGKTTTVAQMVAAWYQSGRRRIGLAAPTGRAAQRLKESLVASLSLVAPEGGEFEVFIKDLQPQTIHRFVGRGRLQGVQLADLEVLVVDEVSMIDTDLLAEVLEGLSDEAALILVGDDRQLPSVEDGALLRDLVELQSRFVKSFSAQLHHSLRAAPELLAAPRALWQPDAWEVFAGLPDPGLKSDHHAAAWTRVGITKASEIRTSIVELVLKNYLETPLGHPGWAGALSKLGVLASTQEGFWGSRTLNRLAVQAYGQQRKASDLPPRFHGTTLFPDLPIMILVNNPQLGLSNGDRGRIDCRREGQTERWWAVFPETGQEWPVELLPEFEPSFVMTIHKSQGSEFERVVACLGEGRGTSREILYTALTRAKKAWLLVADEDAVRTAIASPTVRWSGLGDRILGLIHGSNNPHKYRGPSEL